MLTMRRARGVHFAADEPLVHVPCSHEGTVMDVFRPAVRIGGSAEPSGLAADPRAAEAEVAMLRAQVAWLRAERAALWWAVGHDELTGLANRRLFATLAPRLLRTGQPAAVIVLDLNGFKPINDTLGHEAGDQVLQIVAHRIASCVRDDLVARLGGDEFTAVLISPHRRPHAQWWRPAVTALSAAIAEPMPVAGRILTVTASIGVAPAHGDVLLTDLLHRADLAMYHAKVSGGQYAAWGRQVARITSGIDAGIDAVNRCPQAVTGSSAPQTVEITLLPMARDTSTDSLTPTCHPHQRDPADVEPASTYQRDDPVWVYREGAWRPGVVESASAWAVMATYRYAGGTGTVVDTMAAEYVLARTTGDAQLDRKASPVRDNRVTRAAALAS